MSGSAMINQQKLLEEVRAFTAEDYKSFTGEPYQWLIGYAGKPYVFTRLKSEMSECAKAAGIKNFAAMFKAYCDTLKSQDAGSNILTPSTTQFGYEVDDKEFELNCGNYICTESGVAIDSPFGGLITVCSHPIMPIKRLVDIDSNEVKIEIAFKRGLNAHWTRAIFDKSTLANSRSITALAGYGVAVTSESAKELVKYLDHIESANFDLLPIENTTDHLGWVKDYGFAPYIENITYDNSGRFDKEFRSVTTAGSYDEWLKLAKQVRASDSIPARIMLAASFASVLVAKLDALPFIVHLWGNVSGIGKSVALMLAASVWANPDIGNGYVKQMNATAVGMEQSAAFCCNLPLCLDELQLIQDRKNFDQMVYMLCEGATKTRGSRNGGLQKGGSWKNCIITTGEMPITSSNSKAGAVNRVIEVECTKPTFANAVEASRIMKANYGWAGKKFVERLQTDSDAMDVMRDVQDQFYAELQGKTTDKQTLSASVLLTADYLANLYIFDDNRSLEVEDITPYLVSKEAANTNQKAYNFLCEWIVQNTNKFRPTKDDDAYQGECWGCFENDAFGNPHTCCVIKSKFDEALTNAGYNPASFLSWAGAEKMIRVDGGHNTKMKRVMKGSAPIRCVFLKLSKAESDEAEKAERKNEEKKKAQMILQAVDVKEELPW